MVSHVDNKTGVRVKPPKNPVFSEAILWFTDALGSIPTIPQADWFNMIQAELLGMAEALGVTPDKLDDGQLGKALIAAFEKVGGDIANLPKVLDRLGDSAVDAASQRIVNVVNKLAKDAMQSSLQANDKANQAKQESYEAKQGVVNLEINVASLNESILNLNSPSDDFSLKENSKKLIV
ncbi:hypothetical protein DC081_03820, partial [Ignatzschineria cameli]